MGTAAQHTPGRICDVCEGFCLQPVMPTDTGRATVSLHIGQRVRHRDHKGQRVTGVVRSLSVDSDGRLGADVVLPMTGAWSKAVREHTGGRGADVVVDPVGGEPFDEAVRALATEGRLLVLGFAAGTIPSVKVNRLLLRNAGVLGVGWREYVMANPDAQAEYGRGVGRLVAEGLRPPAPQRYPLSEGRAALESLAAGGVYGKVILQP